MTSAGAFPVPAGGFTIVAPPQDACEGDACLVPQPATAGERDSLLGGDVRDGRVEG